MPNDVYSTLLWQTIRAAVLARDGNACVARRLFGGDCSDALHVHHIRPVAQRPDLAYELENLVTCCSAHHPVLEALRRLLTRKEGWRRCPHNHTTSDSRRQCEERLNAEQLVA